MAPKRALEGIPQDDQFLKRQAGGPPGGGPPGGGPPGGPGFAGFLAPQGPPINNGFAGSAMKLLFTESEATAILGWNGPSVVEIQQGTGTEIQLSNPNMRYPGTMLQELNIRGGSEGSVMGAAAKVFMKITEHLGSLASNDTQELNEGEARIKLVVPSKAARTLLGKQGSVIKHLREQTGIHFHIELQPIPPGSPVEVSEQVISLAGPLSGIQLGLQKISQVLSSLSHEPWFATWATSSQCGVQISPDIVLFQDHLRPASAKVVHPHQNDGVMAIKLLVYDFEGSSVLGKNGARIQEISASTQTKINMTSRQEFYPGTQLQELRFHGQTQDNVLNAALLAMHNIASAGKPLDSFPDGGPGPQCEVRVKLLVPLPILKMLTDNGGCLLQQMQDQSNMSIRIGEEGVAATALLVEQVLNLNGPLGGCRAAFGFITSLFASVASEPWFAEWSTQSQCVKVEGAVMGGQGNDMDPMAQSILGKIQMEAQTLTDQQNSQANVEAQAQAQMQAQAQAQAQAEAQVDMQSQAKVQALAQKEVTSRELGMGGLMGLLSRKKGITGKGMQAITIQLELLMEMELKMEKELLQEMEEAAAAVLAAGKAEAPIPMDTPPDMSNTAAVNPTSDPTTMPTPAAPPVLQSNGAPPAVSDLPSTRGVPMAIKFLADANEVKYIKNNDVGLAQLQLGANARIVVSDETFPGCPGLHEVRVLAESAKALMDAMIAVLTKITEITGTLCCGEQNVEFGQARIKMLVPARAAAAVIGPSGQNVKQLQEVCGVKALVDMNSIPCTRDMAEQGICLSGSMQAVFAALPTVFLHVQTFATEKWFRSWITTSNAGKTIPGLTLWASKDKVSKKPGSVSDQMIADAKRMMSNAPISDMISDAKRLMGAPPNTGPARAPGVEEMIAQARQMMGGLPPEGMSPPAGAPVDEAILMQMIAQQQQQPPQDLMGLLNPPGLA